LKAPSRFTWRTHPDCTPGDDVHDPLGRVDLVGDSRASARYEGSSGSSPKDPGRLTIGAKDFVFADL
jgi:hypothetical protein